MTRESSGRLIFGSCQRLKEITILTVVVAAYQAVILNLRLDSDETRLLGVETHVCELQLLLSALEAPAGESVGRVEILLSILFDMCNHSINVVAFDSCRFITVI